LGGGSAHRRGLLHCFRQIAQGVQATGEYHRGPPFTGGVSGRRRARELGASELCGRGHPGKRRGDEPGASRVNLNGGDTIANLIAGGFIFVLGGDELYVDLDGSGVGGGDDILVATFTDGGAGFDINFDVLV